MAKLIFSWDTRLNPGNSDHSAILAFYIEDLGPGINMGRVCIVHGLYAGVHHR